MVDETTPTTDTIAEGGGEQSRPKLDEINERPGQTDSLEARRRAANESDRYAAEDLAVEDGQVRVSDDTLKQQAAEDSVYDPDDLRVTDDGRVEAKRSAPEKVSLTLWDESDPSGEVAWVGPDGRRIDTGTRAGARGDPYFARVDVPDTEGEWRLQVGDRTVETVDVGPAGAARDVTSEELNRAWNGNVIELDEDRGTATASESPSAYQEARAASADPDVVAGAGADEALQAGAEPEQLSPRNPISETEGEQIADRIDGPQADQGESRTISDPTDLNDADDNRAVRERVASQLDGVSADEVDIVATGSGYEAVGPGGETVTSLGSGGGVPGRQPTDATFDGSRSVGDRSTGAGATAGLEAARRQARQQVAGQSDRIDEADVQTEVVDGRVEASVDQPRRISDPSEVEGQTERVLENRGEVRASVNRYGQRQLDQQAISTGTRDPTPGTTPGLVDRVLTADADPEIARDLTDSGGLLAEEGDRGTPVTNATGISEQDLREPSDPILPGVLPSRQQLRRGGAGETALFRSDAEDPAGTVPDREGVGERALEGAAVAGASILNVRERAADGEQIVEGVQALPREVREEGAGDVGETLTALGRRQGVETARRFESDPVRASSGLALDVAGGAVAVGRIPDTRDLKAEVDPRIGMFGETIESRALGLRSDGADTDAGVDVDRSQTVGDQVSGLPTERPGGLSAEVVDEARGVSGPSRTSRVRGELERGIDRVRERFQTERDRLSVDTRVGAGVGGVEVRRESRGDQGPELTEDRVSPNLYQQSVTDQQRRTRQAQEGGDFEGAPSPFGRDGATFDPTADADSRRRVAERRFAEQDSGVDLDGDTRRAFSPDVRGGVAGGLLAGAFGRAEQAQQSTVTTDAADFADTGPVDRVDVTTGVDTVGDVRGGVDLDQRVDTRLDQNTRIDTGQDIRQDLDTRQDIDTRRDLDTRRDFGSDFDPDYDPDRNPDFDTDTDIDPRPDPRPDPGDAVGFGVGFGFEDEEFENRIATPSQFFF
jgi:hypothetical protein